MSKTQSTVGKYLALSGGVGGAKLVLGLAECLATGQLEIVANTGDDFEHLGLHISPDLDSVMYALAGLNDAKRGWGRADESWTVMASLEKLGGRTWFQLGDKDLATHIVRTEALRSGKDLSQVTEDLCDTLKVTHKLLPMTDQPVRTMVNTTEGQLSFQEYFVRRQCMPTVTGFEFKGGDIARPHLQFITSLSDATLSGVVICPSNPYVSIDPILGLSDVRKAIVKSHAPVLVVSPIVAGKAIKGPAGKMMRELGHPVDAISVAKHYADLADYFLLDQKDKKYSQAIESLGMKVLIADSLMTSRAKKIALARCVIKALEEHRR